MHARDIQFLPDFGLKSWDKLGYILTYPNLPQKFKKSGWPSQSRSQSLTRFYPPRDISPIVVLHGCLVTKVSGRDRTQIEKEHLFTLYNQHTEDEEKRRRREGQDLQLGIFCSQHWLIPVWVLSPNYEVVILAPCPHALTTKFIRCVLFTTTKGSIITTANMGTVASVLSLDLQKRSLQLCSLTKCDQPVK